MNWKARFVFVALLLSSVLPTQAQDTVFMTHFNDSAAFLQSYIGNEALGAVAQHQADRVAGTSASADLQFGNDRNLSETVRNKFIESLIDANPQRRSDIDNAFESDWLKGYASDIARPNGLDPQNLADAYTAYVIASWALVNGQTTLSSKGITAVRDNMRLTLSHSASLTDLSVSERQALGEELIYNTVLVMANRVALLRTPDPKLSDAATEHYSAQFLAAGLDLRQLQLTAEGLVSR